MRTERHFTCNVLAIACAVLATLFLVACQQGQPPTSNAPPEPKPATTDVYVIFEGPWAIVPDPKDANSVLALAPKTKSHRPLALVNANKTLEAGVYELQVPPHGNEGPTFDKGIFRVKVDPHAVQRALDNRSERYAIRLPRPEAYVAETRYRSRVGSTYPPDASTEMDYVTSISLRYSVTSKTGFSLAGTQDAGPEFRPLLLSVDTPTVRFEINPAEDTHDPCNTHARRTFHELARLLGLTLYVDFPESPGDCHKKDPQLAQAEKAQMLHGLPTSRGGGLFAGDFTATQEAGIAGGVLATYFDFAARRVTQNLVAAFYFFHSGAQACTAPIIVGITQQ
jgi:hypothetical protein